MDVLYSLSTYNNGYYIKHPSTLTTEERPELLSHEGKK